MSERLPLFPLGTVLVPGLVLPLHLFEPRYRRLLDDLLALPEPQRRFGVVAIREGREVGEDGARALHEVGTVASLRQVERYEDGRADTVSVGTTRFRLRDLLDDGSPYLVGDVEEIDDGGDEDPEAAVLATTVRSLFGDYLGVLADVVAEGVGVDLDAVPDDATTLSWVVAATTLLDLPERQALLAAPGTADRLRAEAHLLRRERVLVRRLRAVPVGDALRLPHSLN